MSPFQILVYHRIGSESSPEGFTLDAGIFREQMETLRRRYRPMRLGEIVDRLSQGKAVPPRTVAVTFDDGYREVFETALPILQETRIPATLFVTTGYLGGQGLSPRARMLSWKMVKEMHREGMEIGSHTVTHPNLRTCGPGRLHREISSSRERLEQALRAPVSLFAYPYGHARSFDKGVQDCVRKAGYRAACSNLPGSNALDSDLYALRRVSLSKNEIRCLAFQLSMLSKGLRVAEGSRGIQGVNARTAPLWRTRCKEIGKPLRRDDLFQWPSR